MNIFEQWTFDELGKQGFAIFTPYKDKGVDCIVIGKDIKGRPQRIQIKGSRAYGDGGGWYQFQQSKLKQATEITDFWIFVITTVGKKGRFVPEFFVIPTTDLYEKLSQYSATSQGRYNLYLGSKDEDGKRLDKRGYKSGEPIEARDYTNYHNAWKRIKDRL